MRKARRPSQPTSFPFIRILKFCDRAWFSTDSERSTLSLCSHTSTWEALATGQDDLERGREWRHQDQTLTDLLGGESCIVSVCACGIWLVNATGCYPWPQRVVVAGQTLAMGGTTRHCCCTLGCCEKRANPVSKKPARLPFKESILKKMAMFMSSCGGDCSTCDAIEANQRETVSELLTRGLPTTARVGPALNSRVSPCLQAPPDEEYQQLSQPRQPPVEF